MHEARKAGRQHVIEKIEPRFALDAPEFEDGEVMGLVDMPAINAASGLVASRNNEDVLWLQNDLGDSRVFAVNSHGDHVGTFETGVNAVDWEDIAIGPGPDTGMDYIYIADTGDNSESRTEIAVYRVAEPQVAAGQSPVNETLTGVSALRFRYPDGSHDTETLIVDPDTGDFYFVTKRDARSRIYRAELPQSTTAVTTLEFVGELTWTAASAGDISPSGRELILKDLSRVYYYSRPDGVSIAEALTGETETLPYRSEPLGEGLTFDADGSGYFTHSEGANQPLYYYQRVSTPSSADLNGDGRVDRIDVRMLAVQFGRTDLAANVAGDLDGDGSVNLADIALMQTQLTPASAAQATSAQVQDSLSGTSQTATARPARRAAALSDILDLQSAVDQQLAEWPAGRVRRLRRA